MQESLEGKVEEKEDWLKKYHEQGEKRYALPGLEDYLLGKKYAFPGGTFLLSCSSEVMKKASPEVKKKLFKLLYMDSLVIGAYKHKNYVKK